MKKLKQILVFLCVGLLAVSCCFSSWGISLSSSAESERDIYTNPVGGDFTDNATVARRLDVIFSEFPVGSYFSYNGKPCTCHGGQCHYYGGCNCISIYEDPEKNGEKVSLYSVQCLAFAHYSFYKIFGFMDSIYYEENEGKFYSLGALSSSQMTVQNVKKLFANAKTGANIRVRAPHSMILLQQDDAGLTVLHANVSTPCMVKINSYTWEEFTSKYKNSGIEYIYMPVSYPESTGDYVPPSDVVSPPGYSAGQYEVTASNSGLRLRSGPGTDYAQLALIPDATVVRVTQVSDGWGKVVYEGKEGWIALQYAEYLGPLPNSLSVTLSQDRSYVYAGVPADFSSVTVTMAAEDGSVTSLTPADYTISYSAPSPGNYTATVTSGTLTATFAITALPYGDLNGDGTVTASDAMILARGETSLTLRQKEGADANGDGTVDRSDADVILQYLTGRISVLPMKEE